MRGEQEKICFEQIKMVAIKKTDMQLLRYWNKAVANSDSNAFPDFIFPNGFIEHFQVSAANETKKGSAHNIAVNDFEQSNYKAFDQERKEFLQSPSRKNASIDTYDMKVITHEMASPEYSYDSFVRSFKKNFEKHIKSLQKYNGEKAIGIFLIELVGARVTVIQNGRFRVFFRLSIDKDLLEYINEFSGYLKYIVFANSEDYELLDIKNIPTLLQNIPTGLKFDAGRCKNIKLNLFIDI
ncbi:MAG: hypothetical protein SO532_04365 [Candidatus Borkfalkiaceae bacterium]|nr:hypothetical protein [Christensenellaceae bacterium]